MVCAARLTNATGGSKPSVNATMVFVIAWSAYGLASDFRKSSSPASPHVNFWRVASSTSATKRRDSSNAVPLTVASYARNRASERIASRRSVLVEALTTFGGQLNAQQRLDEAHARASRQLGRRKQIEVLCGHDRDLGFIFFGTV